MRYNETKYQNLFENYETQNLILFENCEIRRNFQVIFKLTSYGQ